MQNEYIRSKTEKNDLQLESKDVCKMAKMNYMEFYQRYRHNC